MTTRLCSQCEAPLPAAIPGEPTRCAFCGAEHEPALSPTQRKAIDLIGELEAAKRSGKRERSYFPIILVVGGLAVLAAIVVGVILATSSNDTAEDAPGPAATTVAVAPPPAAPEVKRLPVAELGRAALDMDQEIDAPPPATELSRFDAVANLEWATRIARAWSTDAEIWDLEVRGLKADGTADLTSRPDFSAEYQFKSAARRAAAIQLGAVSEKGVPTDLDITVKGGRVTARSFAPTAAYLAEVASRPALRLTCPLAKAVEAALASGLMRAPFWTVEISFKEELGWNWSFDNGTRRVSAVDCAAAAPEKSDR
jgi:hypothetical protein